MTIYVNNQPALLKAGSSFDYISENRLFLGRDGYTLTLTFPLKDCPQNREIFGHLERMDVTKKKLLYECSIVDRSVSLFGTLQVTGIDDSAVKAQFSEGRCEQTVNSSLDDIYINQLDLGEWPKTTPSEISPQKALSASAQEVAFPWVNTSYPDVINNLMTYDGLLWQWHPDTTQLSWQLKLYQLTKRICEALGYKVDFSEWSASPLRFLIVCNTLPAAWDIHQYARALPTWTVAEYFEKLELFLSGEFDFDHRTKTVKFSFSKTVIDNLPETEIKTVVDAYDVEVSKDDDTSCDYIGSRTLVYKDAGHNLSNYYSCDWILQKWPENGIVRYDTMEELLAKNPYPSAYWEGKTFHVDNLYGIPITGASGRPGANGNADGYPAFCLLYAKDVDTYFVYRLLGYIQAPPHPVIGETFNFRYKDYALQPINVFGSQNYDADESEEIDFVPVCIDHTDNEHGYVMFLSPSEYNEGNLSENYEETAGGQLRPAYSIESGDKEKASAYYDTIFVAFGTGGAMRPTPNLPCPSIDYVVMSKKDYFCAEDGMSLRRYGESSPMTMNIPEINPRQKFKFSFLSDSIPNPRSIFNIRGKRYICEKITATFTEDGMSQLLKGEFYPLLEEE